jgi:hypothetical protein
VEEAGRVIQAAWAVDLKRTIQMRARETKLTQMSREFERIERNSYRRPDGRRRPNASAIVFIIINSKNCM